MIREPSRDFGCPTIPIPKGVHVLSGEVQQELYGLGQTHPPAQVDDKLKVNARPLYASNFVPGDEMKLKVATEHNALVVGASECEGMEIDWQQCKKTCGGRLEEDAKLLVLRDEGKETASYKH
jgi:hypothetical protein